MNKLPWRLFFVFCFILMLSVWTVFLPVMLVGGAAIGAYRGMKASGYSGRRGYAQIIAGFRNEWSKLDV